MEHPLPQALATTLRRLVEESGWSPPITIHIAGKVDGKVAFYFRSYDGGEVERPDFDAVAAALMSGVVIDPPLWVTIVNTEDDDSLPIVIHLEHEGAEPRFVTPKNLA